MAHIHPTAVVSTLAEIADDVLIGPFVVVEDDVQIEAGCQLAARVVIKSGTTIGRATAVAEGAILGGKPQHLRAEASAGRLCIGQGNIIRENVTIHAGLHHDDETRVGDGNMLMVNSHVAHDCVVGNHVVIVNNALLAGHVTVGDFAYVAGAAAVHQYCRIGRFAMLGGQARVTQDVPPFVTVDGKSGEVVGLNLVGLRRAGISPAALQQLKAAYRMLYRDARPWKETLQRMRRAFPEGVSAEFAAFVANTERGIVQARRRPRVVTMPFPSRADGARRRYPRKAG